VRIRFMINRHKSRLHIGFRRQRWRNRHDRDPSDLALPHPILSWERLWLPC
jgi:hypothetical protein